MHHESSFVPESSISKPPIGLMGSVHRSKSREYSTEKYPLGSTNAFTGNRYSLGPPELPLPGLPPPRSYVGLSLSNGPKGELYRERCDVMNQDNESLQRRLNQVSLELSRIHQEKTDLLKQLCAFEKENFNKE